MLLPSVTSKLFNTTPGRNAILQGICPQIFGLFTVKLAGQLLSDISSHTYLLVYFVTLNQISLYRLKICGKSLAV